MKRRAREADRTKRELAKTARRVCCSLLLGSAIVVATQFDAKASVGYEFTSLAGPTTDTGAVLFSFPAGIAIDTAGNCFVSDAGNRVVRKISSDGLVTTLAGLSGLPGLRDGPAATARFAKPAGLAVDAAGNVIVADSENNAVRKITPDGMVSTLVGAGAQLLLPQAVAVDASGVVYIADTYQGVVRKVTTTSGTPAVTILAGWMQWGSYSWGIGMEIDGTGPAAKFYRPFGLVVDGAGNVLVADTVSHTIRQVTPAGVVTTVAGADHQNGHTDAIGTAARFEYPVGIATDRAGNLFIADLGNHAIRKLTADHSVMTVAKDCLRYGGETIPSGLAVDATGNTFAVDSLLHVIRKISPSGAVSILAGSPGIPGHRDGAIRSGTTTVPDVFVEPWRIAVDRSGNTYVADAATSVIYRIPPHGTASLFAGAVNTPGNSDGIGGQARFNIPTGIDVDEEGNLYVADHDNRAIRKISPAGEVTTLANEISAMDVAVSGAGDVYAAGSGNIRKITSDGQVTVLAGKDNVSLDYIDAAGSEARFGSLTGIAVDRLGNVYVADPTNTVVRKVSPAGVVTTIAGTGRSWGSGLSQPRDIAIDGTGNLYVTSGNVIQKIGPHGVITTVAGGSLGSEDGLGVAARFNTPVGIALDAAGNLYVADTGNRSVRKGVPTEFVAPVIAAQPESQLSPAGGEIRVTAMVSGPGSATHQWLHNGLSVSDATGPTLVIASASSGDAGLYTAVVTMGGWQMSSDVAIVGIATAEKVIGSGAVLQPDIRHPNGNVFDQIRLAGVAETITADTGQVTRTSFLDLDGDIVQVEFSGAGSLSLVLDNGVGPMLPWKYNQDVEYMRGHAGIVIVGADETTNVSVFSVGRATAVDPTGRYDLTKAISPTNDPAKNGSSLFVGKETTTYDGIADIAFIAILSRNGRFGSLRTANANYFAYRGITGVFAPGVTFVGPIYVGNIDAFDSATPTLRVGAVADACITGGDLFQDAHVPVQASGITQLRFTAGSDSHGNALPAQKNKAVLIENGTDVTARLAGGP